MVFGIFLIVRPAHANCMWTLNNQCTDIGTTVNWTAADNDSYCGNPANKPNGATLKCCCAADTTATVNANGCCAKKDRNTGTITTANLTGEACQQINYADTIFYQDQKADSNQCVGKNTAYNSNGCQVGNDYVFNPLSFSVQVEAQCAAGETLGDSSRCGGVAPCCCRPDAATAVISTPPKFTIPELQIPIDTLTLSAPKCTPNDDGTYQCQIPWLSQYILAIYNYGLSIAGILAAIVLMAGGLLWLISGGDASKVTQAKELIVGSVTGLIILASSYIILVQINPDLVQLYPITIGTIKDSEPVSSEGNPDNVKTCTNCVNLDSRIPYKNGGQVITPLNTKLSNAWTASNGLAWRVTEAYPPSSDHQSTCHYNGACADVALTSGKTCADVDKLINIMKNAGLKVLNEYTGCGGTQTTYTTGGHLHIR